jgi:Virulence factor Evf
MLIVCTKDRSIIAWAKYSSSGANLWGTIITIDPNFTQDVASSELFGALQKLGVNEPLCLSAHGNDYEIGDEGSNPLDWSWSTANIANMLDQATLQGYSGSILISACAKQLSNFSARLVVELEKIQALNGVWIYGYNKPVGIEQQYPDPTSLARQVDLQGTQVRFHSDSEKRRKTMTSKAASFRHHYSNRALSPLIEEGHSYFDSLGLAMSEKLDPTIQDSDGLVSYIVASSNPPPKEIEELYKQIAPIMEGLTNVVISAVIKQAGTDDKKKHDPLIWKASMNAMCKAFCGGFSTESQKYNKTVKGLEIATSVINILMTAAVSQGAALGSFVKFLQSQGETMRLQVSGEGDRYQYASVSIVHEIFQASDGRWIYVPKFKSYFTQFSRETFKVTAGCGSYESFEFNFDLQVMTGAFMVENWKNFPSFRNEVQSFINKFQKANIKDSENYFDGIFNSTQE